jgi:two-component sensor histidine kinase
MPSRSFPGWAQSVPAARAYITESLRDQPPNLCETAALLVSELATNAIRHAGGEGFEVSVQHPPAGGRLWIGVTDTGQGRPTRREPAVTDPSGRGLQLVGTLAERWGVRRNRDDDAKTVWFELAGAVPAAPA